MNFRKAFFWLHLISGLVAGLAIAVMCFTGAALAFEKQLIAWAERDVRIIAAPAANAERLSLDELTRRVRQKNPEARPTAIVVTAAPRAAVAFQTGRDTAFYADPYTGEIRTPDSARLRGFLHTMEEWHRWLALSGDSRPIGKLINGIANAAFCLLAVTGLYLWLPRTWSWRSVRALALFDGKLSGKARDFNWHNVIGLWSAPILIVLTLTALPMSFRWANSLLFQLVGDQAPAQGGPGGGAPGAPAIALPPAPDGARPLSRDALFATAAAHFTGWEQITIRLGNPAGGPPGATPGRTGDTSPARTERSAGENRPAAQPVTLTVKLPAAWPRTATTTVILHPLTGEILREENFVDLTAGRRARTWTRFLHTGEALGLGGQIFAALASLGGCVLVYTGFALSWRRFFRRRTTA